MNRRILSRFLASVAILAMGTLLSLTPGTAKPEYARRTGKECNFCHPSDKNWRINDAGEYYQQHKNSLAGYKPKDGAQQPPAKQPKNKN